MADALKEALVDLKWPTTCHFLIDFTSYLTSWWLIISHRGTLKHFLSKTTKIFENELFEKFLSTLEKSDKYFNNFFYKAAKFFSKIVFEVFLKNKQIGFETFVKKLFIRFFQRFLVSQCIQIQIEAIAITKIQWRHRMSHISFESIWLTDHFYVSHDRLWVMVTSWVKNKVS